MSSNHDPIRSVLVVGGGTAGWMTAAYLQRAFGADVDITLVESPAVPKIGVGEATVPNLQRVLFDFLGIAEEEWMRAVNGAFKAAIRFVGWRKPSADGKSHHFYHPFGVLPMCDGAHLPQHWFHLTGGQGTPFAQACYAQVPALDAKRSPKRLDGQSLFAHAWHFDAERVAAFLCDWATARGVTRIVDHVVDVESRGAERVAAVQTASGRRLTADLFVDCTGFRGLLINRALAEPFIDMNDYLLCDRAVAACIPHDDAALGVEPYTSAIAMKAGWTWKIPMLGRFGSGYVYASRFASDDEAKRDFCALWRVDPEVVEPRVIHFRTGRNRRAWVGNCVSIGLSSCFLEPLESTGIHFITAAIYQLAKHFPSRDLEPELIAAFNREIEVMFDDCRDFVQAHYFVTDRDDTLFWRANREELVLSDAIRDKVALYESGLPVNLPAIGEGDYYGSIENELRQFWTNNNYYAVFSGLGLLPKRALPRLGHRAAAGVDVAEVFERIAREQRALRAELPSTYEYLRHFHHKPVAA